MASPDGTRISAAPSVTDAAGTVWTVSYLFAQRNGLNTTAHATELQWWRGSIYVLGRNGHWWQFMGGNAWKDVGADPNPPRRAYVAWARLRMGGGVAPPPPPPPTSGGSAALRGQEMRMP